MIICGITKLLWLRENGEEKKNICAKKHEGNDLWNWEKVKNKLNICVQSGKPKEHKWKTRESERYKPEKESLAGSCSMSDENTEWKPQGRTVNVETQLEIWWIWLKRTDCKDVESKNCTREGERVQGMTGRHYRVPLCRMPIRYRVPGLLWVKRARGNQRAKIDVGRRYGMRTAGSDWDKIR